MESDNLIVLDGKVDARRQSDMLEVLEVVVQAIKDGNVEALYVITEHKDDTAPMMYSANFQMLKALGALEYIKLLVATQETHEMPKVEDDAPPEEED